MDNKELREQAEHIDRLLADLDDALSVYAQECQARNKAYKEEQRFADRWPHQSLRLVEHKVYGAPFKHLRNAAANHLTLRKAFKLRPTRAGAVASHYEGDTGDA